MTEEKLARLLERLHNRTMDGKVKWEATARKNVYQVAFPEYVIQVGPDDSGDIVLRLYNQDNILLEIVRVEAIQHYLQLNALEIMSELYTAARRTALNTDKAVDDLLSALERDDT